MDQPDDGHLSAPPMVGHFHVVDTSKDQRLGFSALFRKMDEFLLSFDAYVMGELAGAEMLREEQESELARVAQGKAQAQTQLDAAQMEQNQLWADLARQKEEDERERQALAALEGSHQDLSRRLATVSEEVAVTEAQYEAQTERLAQKRAELHRARLSTQQDRQRLEQLVGVKIVPHHENLRVFFSHTSVHDPEARASFLLELNDERRYSGTYAFSLLGGGEHDPFGAGECQREADHGLDLCVCVCLSVRHARPKLAPNKLGELSALVNRTRDPWDLIKRMRALFRAQGGGDSAECIRA